MDITELDELFNKAAEHHQNNRLKEATLLYRQILAFKPSTATQKLTLLSNDDVVFFYLMSKASNNLAILLSDIGALAEAKAQYQQAIAIQEGIRTWCDDNEQQWPIKLQNDLASAYMNLAVLLCDTGALAEAKVHYQQAIAIREGIRTWCDDNEQQWPIELQDNLANTYMNLAILLQSKGALYEAKAHYQQAIAIQEDIRTWCDEHEQQWPIALQNDLAGTYMNLAILLQSKGALVEAKAHYQQAIAIQEDIRTWCDEHEQQWPVEFQNDLASAYMNLAVLLQSTGALAEAKAQYQQAIVIQEDIRTWCDEHEQQWPIGLQNVLASANMNLAGLLSDTDALVEAKAQYQQAIAIREGIRLWCDDNEQQWPIGLQDNLASAYMNLAILLSDTDTLAEAKTQYQQAIAIREGIRLWCDDNEQQWPIELQNNLASGYMNLAALLSNTGALAEARAQYQEAFNLIGNMRSWCKDNQQSRPLEIKQTELYVWRNYLLIANISATERFLDLAEESIALLDMYTDAKSQDVSFQLLHRMVAFSLKHNEINLAVKLIHCVQGRELAYKLEASQLTGNEPDVVTLFAEQREHYRTLLAEFTQHPNRENDKAFLVELSTAKDAYSQSRASVAALPEYAPLLSPLNIEVTDIQATQGQEQATLLWLSFTDDKEFPVNGVLAIPASGEPQYFDLTDSLGRLLTLHDDLAKLMSGRGYRKNAMDYSEAEIQAVIERYASDGDVKTPEFVIKQVWHNITRIMQDIWQSDNSKLGHWLTHHGIGEVLNLTQGKTHNFPLALGCNETIKHRFIPGLALWRQRQALNLGQENTSNNHSTISSQTCIGKAIASEHEDTSLLIPHTVLEQQALLTQFSDANHNNSNVPSNTSQAISLTTQDTQTAQNVFPHHDKPLGFVHIACHGVPDKDKAGGAKLMLGENSITSDSFEHMKNTVDVAFFNACIAGTTQDDTKGEHHGLLIPLLTKAHQVIAATLPLDDVKASYFAVLLFHYYWREEKPLTESVTLAKADLQTGQWPTQVKDSVINIYHQAVDELPKDYLEYVIRRLYPPIPELCYCLQIFNLNSLNIDPAYPLVQANMKVLISEQFEQGLTAHLQDNYEDEMAKELLTIFVHSIKVFG
jgi:tetratricopeptide (TPR) repeat protein